MTNIPDYSNIQFSMADMERFFKDGDVQLDDKSRKKLNSIFQKCDKKDTEGKKVKGGDGQLTGEERESFMKRIKKKMPELYSQVVDFFIAVDVVEEQRTQEWIQDTQRQIEKKQDEILKDLEKQQQELERKKVLEEIKHISEKGNLE